MKNPNSQSRKWLFTIQKPSQCGLSNEYVHSVLQGLMTVDYYCFCREIAKTGSEHMHIFIYSHSPIRFSTAKKRFPMSHLDKALGTCAENRAYLLKEGKWASTEKAETSIKGSFQEWGTIPAEGKETNPQKSKLIELIQSGMTTSEIILSNPNYAFKTNDINVLRETLLSDKYSRVNRELNVTYIFGSTGAGKSHYIFDHHSPLDICRITSYGNKLNSTRPVAGRIVRSGTPSISSSSRRRGEPEARIQFMVVPPGRVIPRPDNTARGSARSGGNPSGPDSSA